MTNYKMTAKINQYQTATVEFFQSKLGYGDCYIAVCQYDEIPGLHRLGDLEEIFAKYIASLSV